MAGLLADWRTRLGSSRVDGRALRDALPELVAAYTPIGFTLDISSTSWAKVTEDVVVQLDGRLIPVGLEPGHRHYAEGRIDRRINCASRSVRHEHLQLPLAWLGERRGTDCVRRSVLLYDQLGLERVTLSASAYGRYVWAVSGFDFLYPSAKSGLIGLAHRFAHRLGHDLDLSEVEHPWEIAMLEGLVTFRDIAEARSETVEEGQLAADELEQEMPLGKAILLHGEVGDWEGVLHLGPETLGRRLFDTYTRPHG